MSAPQSWGDPWAPAPEHHAAWGGGELVPVGAGYEPALPVGTPVAAPASALPAVPREYHEFWRRSYDRWWKWLLWVLAGIGAMALLLLFLELIYGLIFSLPALVIDRANGVNQTGGKLKVTPALFIANDLDLIAMIPTTLLVAWLISKQRPRWLSSVEGGIRWRWLLKAAMVIVPIFVICMGGLELLGDHSGMHTNKGTGVMLLAVIFLTPFQAAAEEYMLRGFVTRMVGSWIPHRVLGLIGAGIVSAICFTLLHNAQDPWLNTFYFSFALTGSYLTWRTGGLEAAIVMHAINNMIAEATMPWIDFSDIFDRSVGTGSPWGLIQVGYCILTIVGVELAMRHGKIRPRNRTAPGNPALDRDLAQQQNQARVVTPAGTVAAPGTYNPNPASGLDPYGRPGQSYGYPGYGQQPGYNGPQPGYNAAYAQQSAPGPYGQPGYKGQPDPYAGRVDPYEAADPYAPQGYGAQRGYNAPSYPGQGYNPPSYSDPSYAGGPSYAGQQEPAYGAPQGQPSASPGDAFQPPFGVSTYRPTVGDPGPTSHGDGHGDNQGDGRDPYQQG